MTKSIQLLLILIVGIGSLHAQYIPTRSERSGNGPTPDNYGYVYNFGSDLEDNCYGVGGTNDNYNQFDNPNYSCTLNTTLGYFNFSFNGSQTPIDLLVNHFTGGNCQLIEFSSTGAIDMSDPQYQFIEARVRSTVAVDKFGMYIGVTDQDGYFQLGDGPGNMTSALVANTWTTVQLPAIFLNYASTPYDASKTIGLAFYAQNTSDPQPIGTIEIDYVRIGSAAQTSIASGYVSPSGNGYTFGFEGDEFHTCLNQMNVSANANFDYQADLTNNQLLITQTDASVNNDIFSIEFTDQDCFLTTVDLSDADNRMAEIKVTSDQDVSSIGLALMARTSDNTRIYTDVLATFSLTAGVEKTISVPLSLANTIGSNQLDGAHLNGIAFIVNPSLNAVRKSEREQTAATHYTVDYLKIGDVAGTTTSIVPTVNATPLFSVYPNPSAGQLYLHTLQANVTDYSLTVTDYTGQTIYDYAGSSSDLNLDLSSFKQGIYLLKMIAGTKVYTEKIIMK